MAAEVYKQLASLLENVDRQLRLMGLWQQQSPTAQALASTEPFAVDELSFNQWLQFIFLPRMQQMVSAESPLPDNCSIAPMAEEFFKQQTADKKQSAAMINDLAAIDQLISKN
jgi:uncharacterized protein YqcC (DUF446 family)